MVCHKARCHHHHHRHAAPREAAIRLHTTGHCVLTHCLYSPTSTPPLPPPPPPSPSSSAQRRSPTARRLPAESSTSPPLHVATTNPQHTRRSGCKAEWIPMRYGDTWVGNRRSEKPPGEEAHAVNCGPHSQKTPTAKNGGIEPPQVNPSTSGTWTTPLWGGGHVSSTASQHSRSTASQQHHNSSTLLRARGHKGMEGGRYGS
jgi:hypothetical protein